MKLALEVQDVSKVYGDGTKVLDRVNLDVKEGEILALLGENGAGKTTLIGTICGMVQPSSGKILVDGVDAWKNYREARSRLALVCLLYTSPSPRDRSLSRMPSSA